MPRFDVVCAKLFFVFSPLCFALGLLVLVYVSVFVCGYGNLYCVSVGILRFLHSLLSNQSPIHQKGLWRLVCVAAVVDF